MSNTMKGLQNFPIPLKKPLKTPQIVNQQPLQAAQQLQPLSHEREGCSGSCSSEDIDDEDPAGEAQGVAAATLRDRCVPQNATIAIITNNKSTISPIIPSSLVSLVISSLTSTGYKVITLEADDSLMEEVRRNKPTVCLNLASNLSGPLGDAQVPSLLSMVGASFVGASAQSLALLRDRVNSLRALRDAGLPIPCFAEISTKTENMASHISSISQQQLKYPLSIHSGTSGIDSDLSKALIVNNEQELSTALVSFSKNFQNSHSAIIEESIQDFRSLSVGVLGNRTQQPGGLFDTRGYYVFTPLENDSHTPNPQLAPEQSCRITDIAIAAVEALHLTDFARVDLQADPACHTVRVVSVKALPSFNPQSFFIHPQSTLSPSDFISALISLAITRVNSKQQKQQPLQQRVIQSGSGTLLNNNNNVILPNISISPSIITPSPSKQQQQRDFIDDDVDLILSSSSSCSSPPLSPSPAPHGPSQDLAHRYKRIPGSSLRKSDVPPERWNDWRWQLANRMTTAEQLRTVLTLTEDEEAAFNGAAPLFPVAVTPYFASLINPTDPHDPIRLQVLPRSIESHRGAEDIEDSLGEDSHSPVPGIVHRYPDRVLMLVSMNCGCFCRFCTRNRIVGTKLQTGPTEPLSAYYERQLSYIRASPQVRDVLLSGGDPLMLPLRTLDWLLTELHKIPHVEVVRIGSRVPIFIPQRVTAELCTMLSHHHPLWLNTHVNHPNELTPDSCAALARLSNAGIPLGSQTVLLAGINDCPNIMLALVHKLVKNRVRPYYLYICDLVLGASHFRTPTTKLLEIMENLRGHTSGFCIPTAVIDAPHGGGKVPVLPNYVISMNETKTIVRNFEGFVSTYTGPQKYQSHDSSNCKYCNSTNHGAQDGVAALLAGNANTIKPEGWDASHDRRGFSHSQQNQHSNHH